MGGVGVKRWSHYNFNINNSKQEQKVLKTSASRANFMFSNQNPKISHKKSEIFRNSLQQSEIVKNNLK